MLTVISAPIGACMMLYVLVQFNTQMRKQAPFTHLVFGGASALWMLFFPPVTWLRGVLFFVAILLMLRYLYQLSSFSASVYGFLLIVVMLMSSMFASAWMIWLRGVVIDYRRLYAVSDLLYLFTNLVLTVMITVGLRFSLRFRSSFFERIKTIIPTFLAVNVILFSVLIVFLRLHIDFSVQSYAALFEKAAYMSCLLFFIVALYLGFMWMVNRTIATAAPPSTPRRSR